MFNISHYLSKFKNFGQEEKFFKELICSAIKEVVGIEIDSKKISISNGELILKVSPNIKSAIYIKKEKIISKIREGTDKRVLGIR